MEIKEARRPRFVRTQVGGIRITERDVELIRSVSVYRLVRSTHLTALVGGSAQQTLRRLQLLFHHGYLDRPRMHLDFYEHGSEPMIYAVGRLGADLLAEQNGVQRRRINWSAKNRDLTRTFVRHTLLVTDVMVALELGCRALGRVRLISPAEILRQAPEATQKRVQAVGWRIRVRVGMETAELGVVPDWFFGLRFEDEPEGRNRAFFFLEADRASMPVMRHSLRQTSVYRKLLAYAETWRQGLHTAHFGIKRFRVLTVTSAPERVRHLLAANEWLDGGGSPIFLFTDAASLQSGNPLIHVWTNGQGETTRLID